MLSNLELVEDFASALVKFDAGGAVFKDYRPGVGPHSEDAMVKAAMSILRDSKPESWGRARTKRTPDLLIEGDWQIEVKLLRPYGDNNRIAENWSQNLLHPYAGNESCLGDCLKLLRSERQERRGILVVGYEHNPCKTPLEPCLRGFEILAKSILGVELSKREEVVCTGLIHPVHQVARVSFWEVVK
ncbi:hypothetical protein HUU59_09175 [bacterium]|nr:hypothetical protein [bacterium]